MTLATALDAFDAQIREKTAEIRNNRNQIQRYLPQGMSTEAFVALPEDPNIEAQIAARRQDLEAARQAAQLERKPGLSAVTIPVFPVGFAALLAKTFASVSADAERHVTEHIERHHMRARGEQWLTEGLQYVVEDSCPFCAQQIDPAGLIRNRPVKAVFPLSDASV